MPPPVTVLFTAAVLTASLLATPAPARADAGAAPARADAGAALARADAGAALARADAGAALARADAGPGPVLTTPEPELAAAVQCVDPPAAQAVPVLLVHGTSSTPEESWGFGYARVLPELGHPVCTVRLPSRAWDDIQISTEYVVYAVRLMARRSGRRIAVIGHSQGTLQPLWALRFWPDMASLIDDYVALAPPLQGTTAATLVCAVPGRCPAAVWQFRAGSRFIAALNRRPLPAGPSYTAVATLFDELVVPQPWASTDESVSTTVVQRLCPGRPVEHAGLLGDAVAFAIALDALTHAGPADAGRVGRSVCGQALLPGIDAAGYAAAIPAFVTTFAATALTATWVPAEPPLLAYAQTG